MNRKGGLVLAVILLFGVIGGITWYAFKRVHRAETVGLAVLPRESVAAFGFDGARVRAFPLAQRLRTLVMQQPEVNHGYPPIVSACGFDPVDRIDQIVVGIDRHALNAPPTGGPEARASQLSEGLNNAFQLVVSGRAPRAAILQCVTALLRVGDPTMQIVPQGEDHGRPVLARVVPGGATGTDEPRLVVVDNRMFVGSVTSLSRLLAVEDHREPGAERNESLRNTVHGLGDDLFAWGAVDMAAVRAALPVEATRFLDGLSNGSGAVGNPFGGLGTLANVRAAAFAVQQQGTGVRFESVATYATNGEAQTSATMISQMLTLVGTVATAGFATAQNEYLARVAQSQAFDPPVAAQIPALRALFTLVNGAVGRVRVSTDGPSVHVHFDLSASDLTTVESGIRALLAAEASLARTALQRNPPPPAPPPTPVFE